jgi:D-sedoheptulose 7-phosphate isomerase
VLTSISNDAGYADVFARQVRALGRSGDVLVALSTSGRSESILAALREGRQRGMVTIGFTGESGAKHMASHADLLLAVAARETARIQECHEFVYHHIAGIVEVRLAALE